MKLNTDIPDEQTERPPLEVMRRSMARTRDARVCVAVSADVAEELEVCAWED